MQLCSEPLHNAYSIGVLVRCVTKGGEIKNLSSPNKWGRMSSVQLFMVPLFLEAKTKKELVKKMIQKNVDDTQTYHYKVMRDGKGWCAWFLADATNLVNKDIESNFKKPR